MSHLSFCMFTFHPIIYHIPFSSNYFLFLFCICSFLFLFVFTCLSAFFLFSFTFSFPLSQFSFFFTLYLFLSVCLFDLSNALPDSLFPLFLSPSNRTCRCLALRTTAERWTSSSISPAPTPTPSPCPSCRPTSSLPTTSAASSPSRGWPRVGSRPDAWRCRGLQVSK